jgi:hypothetical protein
MLRIIFSLFLISFLTACNPSSPEDVMPSVPYTGSVKTHTNKVAYLNWQIGRQQTESDPTFISPQEGILGAIIISSIDSAERKRNPGQYNYSFSKAQQAVFMTSLRDALVSHKVFKQVHLITQPSITNKNDVLITVYFKSTHARASSDNYIVSLDTVLNVKVKNKPMFERTYFVQSDPDTTQDKSFRGQQLDASKKLLNQIIDGITIALKQ